MFQRLAQPRVDFRCVSAPPLAATLPREAGAHWRAETATHCGGASAY